MGDGEKPTGGDGRAKGDSALRGTRNRAGRPRPDGFRLHGRPDSIPAGAVLAERAAQCVAALISLGAAILVVLALSSAGEAPRLPAVGEAGAAGALNDPGEKKSNIRLDPGDKNTAR